MICTPTWFLEVVFGGMLSFSIIAIIMLIQELRQLPADYDHSRKELWMLLATAILYAIFSGTLWSLLAIGVFKPMPC